MDAALFEGLCTVTITEVENGSLEFPLPHSFSAGADPIWIFRQAADAMEPTVVRFRISAVCTSLGVHEVLYLVEKHAIGTNGFGRDSMGRVSGPDPKTGTFSRSVTLEHDGKGDPSRFDCKGVTMDLPARLSVCFRPEGGNWKILQQEFKYFAIA